mmetsp:Transcript_11786/g.20921  ORF Transcript_11786/g.20921 Transcript_11786/m.20921 type:complete len:105 (+) Transcript_11786:577-891(+)
MDQCHSNQGTLDRNARHYSHGSIIFVRTVLPAPSVICISPSLCSSLSSATIPSLSIPPITQQSPDSHSPSLENQSQNYSTRQNRFDPPSEFCPNIFSGRGAVGV